MFEITFSPIRSDVPMRMEVSGDTLIVDGEAYDFGALEEGAILPVSAVQGDWCVGSVRRENGVLRLTVRLPHGPDAPHSTRFPEKLSVVEDGPVELPAFQEDLS